MGNQLKFVCKQRQPRPGHATTKAKAAPYGHAAAKANAQGLGSPMGMLPRPRYAAKAKAAP